MNTITSKIPGERIRQYTAWLLYCEAGSLEKTLQIWERVSAQHDTEVIPLFGSSLGKPVSLATLKRWSGRYHWKERTELKNTEDLKSLRLQAKRIKQTRAYKITILLERMINRLLWQLDHGMHVTIRDVYIAWQMHRVEEGLSIGKFDIVTYEAPETKQLDSKTKELHKQIQKTVNHFYLKKGVNELDIP